MPNNRTRKPHGAARPANPRYQYPDLPAEHLVRLRSAVSVIPQPQRRSDFCKYARTILCGEGARNAHAVSRSSLRAVRPVRLSAARRIGSFMRNTQRRSDPLFGRCVSLPFRGAVYPAFHSEVMPRRAFWIHVNTIHTHRGRAEEPLFLGLLGRCDEMEGDRVISQAGLRHQLSQPWQQRFDRRAAFEVENVNDHPPSLPRAPSTQSAPTGRRTAIQPAREVDHEAVTEAVQTASLLKRFLDRIEYRIRSHE